MMESQGFFEMIGQLRKESTMDYIFGTQSQKVQELMGGDE